MSPSEAAQIADELAEIMAGQDALDRFEQRLGRCARLPLWASRLRPVRTALEDRTVALFAKSAQ